MCFFVYFLKSTKNRKIYTGMTDKNPKERLFEHNSGSNKWTRENGPHKLIYYEKYICKEDAMQREKFYKSGFGRKIRKCIVGVLENEHSVSARGGSASGGG